MAVLVLLTATAWAFLVATDVLAGVWVRFITCKLVAFSGLTFRCFKTVFTGQSLRHAVFAHFNKAQQHHCFFTDMVKQSREHAE